MTVVQPAKPSAQRAAPPLPSWPPKRRRPEQADLRWSLRSWLFVVGMVTAAFSAAAVALGVYAQDRLDEARSKVIDRIEPALGASKDLANAVAGQDSGARGYGQVGRDEFLTPYLIGLQGERDATARLTELAAEDRLADVARDVALVQAHLRTWRRDYAEPTIAAVRAGHPEQAPEPAAGKVQSDAAREAATDLTEHLEAQRAVGVDRLQAAARFLRWVFAGIAAGLALLVIAVGVWLHRAVLTPLSGLAREVRLVVSGDVHREVRVEGPHEVIELAADVDAMRRHILAELDALEQAHQRLDEQTRDLERSNRDLEQFAYVASHDLQEPLRKISSFCQLLQRRYGGQLDERGDSYIEFAVDGARRMQQLINDLLAFSRVGRISAGMSAIDLNEVAHSALSQLSQMSEELDARITVEPLPTVRGEAPLLAQLLANLVSNALKFRRPGVVPEVSIAARWRDNGWEVAVADNGIGVEQEYADKVFVIFQRLHSREDYPGTGIGLAMAKKIVEYHGGRIWLDPDREEGTSVRFTLPAYEPAAGADSTVTTEEPTP